MSRSDVELSVDRSRCVFCGEPNECALAKGDAEGDQPCWCVGQAFPESLRLRATEQDGGDSCICRRCLERVGPQPSQS